MKKAVLVAVIGGLALAPMASGAPVPIYDEPEGCVALNPVQPTCSYTAAEALDTFGGVAGRGDWVVKITVGKKKKKKVSRYESPGDGSPYGVEFRIPAGAKVVAKATSPGSGLAVGGE